MKAVLFIVYLRSVACWSTWLQWKWVYPLQRQDGEGENGRTFCTACTGITRPWVMREVAKASVSVLYEYYQIRPCTYHINVPSTI